MTHISPSLCTPPSTLTFSSLFHGPIKHGCVPPTLQTETDHLVTIAKNPYPWLVSMFNRPYGESHPMAGGVGCWAGGVRALVLNYTPLLVIAPAPAPVPAHLHCEPRLLLFAPPDPITRCRQCGGVES